MEELINLESTVFTPNAISITGLNVFSGRNNSGKSFLLSKIPPKDGRLILYHPGVYLDPIAQAELAKTIVNRVTKEGIQILVETVSIHFITGVLISIKNRLIRPQNVNFFFNRKDATLNKIEVVKIIPDCNGTLSNEPDGFYLSNHIELLFKLT